jgi:hypothetical protein
MGMDSVEQAGVDGWLSRHGGSKRAKEDSASTNTS